MQILGYPKMLHAKAFVADGEHVLVGTCNLEAWSLKRFFEIDIGFESTDLATQFDEQFFAPAEEVSSDLQPPRHSRSARGRPRSRRSRRCCDRPLSRSRLVRPISRSGMTMLESEPIRKVHRWIACD